VIVSAVVATYNEERFIALCLESLLQQQGVDEFEIIVVDGASSDGTVAAVQSFAEYGSRIRLVENPRRLQVYALNLGCRAAQGKYIAAISAHTTYQPTHFRDCIRVLERTGADAVGPVQLATGSGSLGTAIAWCMSSPLGIGNARYRFTHREEEVDSVFSIFMPRATFERMGGYDERIVLDEDGEFGYRLRAAGGRIVVSPAIAARYLVRGSLRALARQMFGYGYWRRFTQLLHRQRVPLRVFAPPLLVVALAASLALAPTPYWALGAIVPLTYLAYVLAAMFRAKRGGIGWAAAGCVAAVLPCMHVAYGLGYWRALLTPSRRVLPGTPRHSAAH
jgi:succinoglycan biosynthesis protein ExoA